MTATDVVPHLVSNFREALSILESLRASARPGRGMRHLARRPVVDGLRASELGEVTTGLDGEFPVLCRVDPSACSAGSAQVTCIPLGRISAFVFRTQDERDQVAGKMFENISTDGLNMEVVPALFGQEGPTRFRAEPADGVTTAEAEDWLRADALAGAVGTVLALAHRRPEAAAAAAAFLEVTGGLPVHLAAFAEALLSPDGPWTTPGRAVAAVTSSLRGVSGQDPLELVDLYAEALEGSGYPPDNLPKFKKFAADVITSRRARRPQDLADGGDVLLRALLLVLQRDRIDEVLDDRADGVPPGPAVHVTAAALAGFREGLARMPSAIKQPFRDVLGEFASALETSRSVQLEDLAAPLKLRLPAAPAAAVAPPSTEDGVVPPSMRGGVSAPALIRELQAAAESLGLSQVLPDEGKLGSCPRTGVTALVSLLPASGTETPQLGLRIVLGDIASGALVREALSGAFQTEPGSMLWLPPSSGDFELVFPIGLGAIGDLSRVFRHNVELARRWRTTAAVPEHHAEAAAPEEARKKTRKSRGAGRREQSGASAAGQGATSTDPDMAAEVPQNATEATGAEAAKPAPRRRPRKSSADRGQAAVHQASLLVPETSTSTGDASGHNADEAGGPPRENCKR
jgi:hypothetical protein